MDRRDCTGNPVRRALVTLVLGVLRRMPPGTQGAPPKVADLVERAEREIADAAARDRGSATVA